MSKPVPNTGQNHPMNARSESQPVALDGQFVHLIYSPKGGIEGALLQVDGEPLQLVFEGHDDPAGALFAALNPGQAVSAEAWPEPPSPKGKAQHAVCRFERLLAVDGRKPAKPQAGPLAGGFSGVVVRLNFARHGEANGVVLDSGHFIHTKPDGMARLKLKVGDTVRADGEARPLAVGGGWVVEATEVNGKGVRKPHG